MASKLKKGLISLVLLGGVVVGISGCATTYAGEGALLGAGTGAIIGNQHHHQTLEGAAIGGVLGGLLGSQIQKQPLVYQQEQVLVPEHWESQRNQFTGQYQSTWIPEHYETRTYMVR